LLIEFFNAYEGANDEITNAGYNPEQSATPKKTIAIKLTRFATFEP
jgi:hypothetical protein